MEIFRLENVCLKLQTVGTREWKRLTSKIGLQNYIKNHPLRYREFKELSEGTGIAIVYYAIFHEDHNKGLRNKI